MHYELIDTLTGKAVTTFQCNTVDEFKNHLRVEQYEMSGCYIAFKQGQIKSITEKVCRSCKKMFPVVTQKDNIIICPYCKIVYRNNESRYGVLL